MKIEGNASKIVIIAIVTLIADVVLDIFLIYGLAGVSKLGANGSAYSMVVVELIALVWCVAEAYRKDTIHADMKGLRRNLKCSYYDWFVIFLESMSISKK